MLTSRRVARVLPAGTGTMVPPAVALTAIVTVMTLITGTPARAQELRAIGGVSGTSCVGGFTTFNCVTRWGPARDPYVRLVPTPVDERERARLEARDRNWLARCSPIVERDRYGVGRLRYAAPGCEFGVGED